MNAALCIYCQDLFVGRADTADHEVDIEAETDGYRMKRMVPHHMSLKELRACGETACMLCAVIWRRMPLGVRDEWLAADTEPARVRNHNDFDETGRLRCNVDIGGIGQRTELSIEVRSATSPYVDDAYSVRLGLHRPDGYVYMTPIQPNGTYESTLAPHTFAQIKQWLADCDGSHDMCKVGRTKDWVPTRLLYVGSDDEDPRLIQSALAHHIGDYTTLSHCWGSVDTLKLTIGDLVDFQHGIPMERIPRTYADAISITRSIGIDYIWIDSLCIIQDSQDDWLQECHQMANVYKNGYCNIAALTATDSHGGCFNLRDPFYRRQVIESHWDNHPSRLWEYRLGITLEHIYDTIANSPLHRRAWVLQERHLSPRNIHFGQDMVYWECRKCIASEYSYPDETGSLPMIFIQERRVDLISTHKAYLPEWADIVEQYTAATLSHTTDKLVAISALAREFQQIISYGTDTNCNYLLGLWQPYLAQYLLWYTAQPSNARHLQQGLPSWTWASLDGAIHYPPWTARFMQGVLIDIKEAPQAGLTDFQPVTECVLEISGWLWLLDASSITFRDKKAKPDETGSHTFAIHVTIDHDSPDDMTRLSRNPLNQMLINLRHDILPAPSNSNEHYILLPIQFESYGFDGYLLNATCLGLLLKQVPHASARRFERLGTFKIDERNDTDMSQRLKSEGPVPWIRGIGEELLRQGTLKPLGCEQGDEFECGDEAMEKRTAREGLWVRHDFQLV